MGWLPGRLLGQAISADPPVPAGSRRFLLAQESGGSARMVIERPAASSSWAATAALGHSLLTSPRQGYAADLLEILTELQLREVIYVGGSMSGIIGLLLRVPTLTVQSSNDVAVPLAVGAYLAASIPGARYMLINAPRHLAHMSAPDAVNRAIRSFLDRGARYSHHCACRPRTPAAGPAGAPPGADSAVCLV